MVGPTDNEQIRHVMLNVKAMKGVAGMVRDYDILFMESGIVFANTAGALSNLKGALGAQFGAVGALAARGSMDKDKESGRNRFKGLSVKQILEQSEKSFFIGYADVQSVAIKKGLTGIGKMSIQTLDGKYNCEFAKDQLELARVACSERLASRMES